MKGNADMGHLDQGKIVKGLQELLKCGSGRVPKIVNAQKDGTLLRSSILEID